MKSAPLTPLVLLASTFTLTLQAQDGAKKITIQPKAGATAEFRTTTTQTQNLVAMGQESTNEVVVEVRIHVDEVADDGTVKATATWLNAKGKLQSMMGSMEFDTTKPDSGDDDNPMAGAVEAFHAMMNQKVSLTFGANGKLANKQPLKELADKALERTSGMAQMALHNLVSESALEAQVSVFGRFSAEPVAVGGAWVENETTPGRGGMGTKIERTCKLDSITDEAYVVSTTGKLDMVPTKDEDAKDGDDDPNMEMMRNMMREAKVKDGKGEGAFTVSRKDGMLDKASNVVTMSIHMPNPMGGDEAFVVDVRQSTKTERATGKNETEKETKGAPAAPKK